MNAIPPRRGDSLARADRGFMRGGGIVARVVAAGFGKLLDRIDSGLEQGAIEAWLPGGEFRILGARAPGPVAHVKLNSWKALARLASAGSVGWYKAWALGEWQSPDPVPLFDLFMRNRRSLGGAARARGLARIFNRIRHGLRANSRKGARRNIAFHYDLGNDFYRLWLDDNLHYSSALFADPAMEGESLEVAQQRKADAILDRLDLTDGASLLEIGCGWGALAERVLHRGTIRYDGLTLSEEQAAFARDRLSPWKDQASVLIQDYRDADGQYDAIASVEMVEAVGERYWPDYLATIHRLLKPGGKAALQYICIDDAIFERYANSADFIQTYIFPGGVLLSESRFAAVVRDKGLTWGEPHRFGLDYAETLRIWRERFDAAVAAGSLPSAFDAEFIKLWRYYLMYCEGGFRGGGIDVAQVTLTKSG